MKIFKITFVIFMIITLLGCEKKESNSTLKVNNDIFKIAILKYVTHPALDETEKGFEDGLKNAFLKNKFKQKYEIINYNANANKQSAKKLAESILNQKVNLTVAIATPVAQAFARTPSNIPLLYVAVSDPKGSGILASNRATGIKNVGPHIIEKALQFMRETFPKATKLGTIYNPSEQNSVYVQNILKEKVQNYGFELISKQIDNKSKISTATEHLSNDVDIIYSANDNTVNSTISSVVKICKSKKIPLIMGDLSTLSKGAMFAIGLDYYSVGIDSSDIAVDIINGKDIQNIKPQEAPEAKIWMNKSIIDEFNLTISSKILELIDKQL